ncbi:MAG: hypothetical protein ABIJ37_07495 [Pseudomonadota bacterium]
MTDLQLYKLLIKIAGEANSLAVMLDKGQVTASQAIPILTTLLQDSQDAIKE